jgi:hypothetical protein
LAQAGSATPVVDGTAAVGTSTRFARQDHVHPSDTSRAPLASPALTGTPTTTTATVDTNTTQIASTAFVLAQAGSATPVVDGTAAVGTSTRFARQDHVHPTDTSRLSTSGGTIVGDINLSQQAILDTNKITFRYRGSSPSLATLENNLNSSGVFSLPSTSGTLIGSGDTGTVTSTMILDGTILDADINASAAIATSKISGLDTALTNKQPQPFYYSNTGTTPITFSAPGTAAFSPFSTSNSTLGVDVAANTTYAVDFQIALVGTSTAQSRQLFVAFSNSTCNTTQWGYNTLCYNNTSQINPVIATSASYQSNYNGTLVGDQTLYVEITASAGGTRYRLITVKGIFRTGSTAGKFIPQMGYITNGETNVRIYSGTYISVTPLLGTASNGTWS